MIHQAQSFVKQTSFVYMGEVINVMYLEHDGSMFFNNSDAESVQVHGISPSHMAQLMRNLVCCGGSRMVLKDLDSTSISNLRDCMDKLNEMFDAWDAGKTMRGAE